MSQPTSGWFWLTLAMLIAVAGCAPAYHAYPGGCPSYQYCPPRPLPWPTYSACHCPTPMAARWYAQHDRASHEGAVPATAPLDAATHSGL